MKLRLWRYEMTVTLRKRESAWDGKDIHITADSVEPVFSREALMDVAGTKLATVVLNGDWERVNHD